jgi:hypothetical protein
MAQRLGRVCFPRRSPRRPLKKGGKVTLASPCLEKKFWGSSRYTLAFERFLTLIEGDLHR